MPLQVKFAPKIPVRRKAAQASEAENAASVSGAAENEAFKDLIKAVSLPILESVVHAYLARLEGCLTIQRIYNNG